MKIGNKCSCILLKTNITNGYITIYKNQLDLFGFFLLFLQLNGVFVHLFKHPHFLYTVMYLTKM